MHKLRFFIPFSAPLTSTPLLVCRTGDSGHTVKYTLFGMVGFKYDDRDLMYSVHVLSLVNPGSCMLTLIRILCISVNLNIRLSQYWADWEPYISVNLNIRLPFACCPDNNYVTNTRLQIHLFLFETLKPE